MHIHRIFIVFIISLLAVYSVMGQQAVITVLDQKSDKPVSFAHVSFEPLGDGKVFKALTNEKGIVENKANTKASLGISYVGYKTLQQEIEPGKSYTFRLIPNILNIDEVVVTAQYAPKRADKSIYKVKVINRQTIQNKAANSLDQVMENELNIRVSRDGVLGSGMSLNGLSGEHLKFLVDGVPVIGRLNGNIDISQLNVYNIDHIEFVEGPMSVIYGSNAMAGVVNLITSENQNYKSYTNLQGYFESVGEYNFNATTSLRYDHHIFQVSGGRDFFAGYSENNTGRSKLWKPKRAYFLDGSYIYDKERFKLKFKTSYYDEFLLSKGNLRKPYFETAFDSYFYTKRFTNKLDISKKVLSNRYLNILTAYSVFDRKTKNYFVDLTKLEKTLRDADTTKFHSAMLRGTFSKSDEGRFNYQLGIDLNLDYGSGEKIDGGSKELGDYAAFLSIKYKPVEKLLLQPGIRLIYNTNYDAPLVYSMNAKYDFYDHLSMRGSFARGFRAPSLKELYLDFVDVNHKIFGNENLKAERSYNINGSLLYHADREKHVYEAELNYFYNYIENSIDLVIREDEVGNDPANSVPPYTYLNLNKYATTGFGLSLNYRYYPNLNVKAGLNRTNSIISHENVADQQAMSTDYNLSLNYKWIRYDLDISIFYKYNGKLPIFSVNTEDEIALTYKENFQNLDFAIGKSWFENSLYTNAGLKNIFDNKRIPYTGSTSGGVHTGGDGSSLVGYGRTFFLSASYTIKYLK
ncbi:MAG: TonB-dependent receptor [Bacteroidales bacterium]|nr:TonB-dependent receptor [Bacteroidales bacterium]MCF8387288.1 TonB-dependent receptor [Bacteroidales bacterium]MCF8398722.1 TonB-dependent receptor [Bacteroidales bacterium]